MDTRASIWQGKLYEFTFRALSPTERDMNLSFLCSPPPRILFQGENSNFGELAFSGGKKFDQKQKLHISYCSIEGLMKVFSEFKREGLDISLKIYLLVRLLLWVETFPYWCFPGNHYWKLLWTRGIYLLL